MTDFLERYGEQLDQARVRRRRRAFRVSFLAVATPAVATAFVFVTADPDIERPAQEPTVTAAPQPVSTWTPPVGRPDKGLPATISREPVAQAALDALAVLR